jgi:hypothetical protein
MKMTMEKIVKKLGILLLFLVAASCDLDGDLQNPNEVSVSGADVNLLMNAVQLDFADFYNNAHSTVAPLVRHNAMTGGFRYSNAFLPQNQDGLWYDAYQTLLINAETMIPLAKEKNLTTHVAVGRILQAYTYMTLVDLFGDVPASAALKGSEGDFNPTADGGADVYAKAIEYLNEARTELAKTGTDAGAGLTRDIYYGGSRANWTALANTLELKAWVNISTLPARASEANAKIATLLTSNIIDTPAENFTYKWGTATVPDSRHPFYNQYYGPNAGQAGGYIGTGILYEAFRGKPDPTDPTDNTKFTQDPRWRYYFYRQVGSIKQLNAVDPKALGCTLGAAPDHYVAGNYPFCAFDPGFYGRDHGDASGTPPDPPVITAAGIYPAGGRPDNTVADLNVPATNTYATATKRGDGADGAGITPIYMSFFTDYMKAEILARGGDAAGAKAQLRTAIMNSVAAVKSFAESKNQAVTRSPWTNASWSPGPASDCSGLTGTAATACVFNNFVNTYVDAVNVLYDAAPNKLKIIGREYWVATWGNAVEAYNSYRRTGGPDNFQPTLQTDAGPWLRSIIYPSVYVNLNSSATQKPLDTVVKVFWDGNPATLN